MQKHAQVAIAKKAAAPLSKQGTAAQHPTKKKKRRLRRVPPPMPALTNDFIVMSLKQWRSIAALSERAARRLIRAGGGPVLTKLNDSKFGVTLGNHKRWLEARTPK
jgi:hypothetical protein